MKKTTSPKPNWPSSRPKRDNILEAAKIKAIIVKNQIYPAYFTARMACGSLLSTADLSTGAKPNIKMVVASGKSNIQPFHMIAARNICAGTATRKTRFQSLFLVSQPVCLAITAGLTCVLAGLGCFIKSCIRITGDFLYRIYNCILSQIIRVNKQITGLCISFFLFLCCSISLTSASESYSQQQLASVIAKTERIYKIPSGLLSAIAEVESGNRAYALNIAGSSIYAKSLSEAKRIAQQKIDSGATNIDLGLMQLNWRWHGSAFANIEEMLQPEKNIEYAAKLLKSLHLQHGNWQAAIRYYHSSKPRYHLRYSHKVAMHWLSIN